MQKSNAGTIAGAVVGGIAGLGLVVVAILYLVRRQRHQHSGLLTQDFDSQYRKPELDAAYPRHHTSSMERRYYTSQPRQGVSLATPPRAELESKQAKVEAGGRPVHEMDASTGI